MMTIRHLETGERQFVESLDGIDLAVWEATSEPVPADLAERAYVVVAGNLQPKPPVLERFDFIRLWTPAEILAAQTSTDDTIRLALFYLSGAANIDLGEPAVQLGILTAQSLNIITEARAARILAGLPPE